MLCTRSFIILTINTESKFKPRACIRGAYIRKGIWASLQVAIFGMGLYSGVYGTLIFQSSFFDKNR